MQPTDPKRISNRVKRLSQQKTLAQGAPLTYKSSVSAACEASGLELWPIELWPTQRAWRYFFVTPAFKEWHAKHLPQLSPTKQFGELSVQSQFRQEWESFSNGFPFDADDELKRLKPIEECVWEIKSDDLRILGWFPARDYFIAHIGKLKEELLEYDDYKPHIDEIVAYRKTLITTLPDHVYGGYPNVITDRPIR